MKRFTVDIDENLHLRFKMVATAKQTTMKKLIVESIEKIVNQYEHEQQKGGERNQGKN